MSKIQQLLHQTAPEDRLFHDWQFAFSRRLLQILEAKGITQQEFAKRAHLTDAQVSSFVHAGGNPSLRTLARISALLDVELFSWTNSDEQFDDAQKVHNARISR